MTQEYLPYMNIYSEFNLAAAQMIYHRGRGRGRGRGRSRGPGVRGGWRGRYNNVMNNTSRENRELPTLNPDLIEPKKLYVCNLNEYISEDHLMKHLSRFAKVIDVCIIRRNFVGFRAYGFVTFETEEDVKKILNLEKRNCKINGTTLRFNPARKQFKIPGMPGFERQTLADREFDLEPMDPSIPSIHILIDDVLLKIFDYLPLKDQLLLDGVCRRWQSLLHTYFRSKASLKMKSDLTLWLEMNNLSPKLSVVSKVLTLCGEHAKELTIGEIGMFDDDGRIFRVIGQLCPSLEKLSLTRLHSLNLQFLKDFVNNCTNLKSFSIMDRSSFDDNHLKYMLTSLPTLESLCLDGADICGQCFYKLPDTLEVLKLTRCNSIESSSLCNIPKRCPLIKILRLESIPIPIEVLIELGNKCLSIEDLSIKTISTNIDLRDFKNLKRLKIVGHIYSVNFLIDTVPHLEELYLDGIIKENSMDSIDFSILPNLRVLVLPLNNSASFSGMSIKSLSYCSKLVTLKYKGSNEHKFALLEIIRRCQSLMELNCLTVTLRADDIESFVEASKRRTKRLKIAIGLDEGAMDQVEKLNEANYEIEMFDAENLFSEGPGGLFGTFEDYEDMLDDIDGYDSDESYEDLWDEMGFGVEDFDGWEHFAGLHPLVNFRWWDDADDDDDDDEDGWS